MFTGYLDTMKYVLYVGKSYVLARTRHNKGGVIKCVF